MWRVGSRLLIPPLVGRLVPTWIVLGTFFALTIRALNIPALRIDFAELAPESFGLFWAVTMLVWVLVTGRHAQAHDTLASLIEGWRHERVILITGHRAPPLEFDGVWNLLAGEPLTMNV